MNKVLVQREKGEGCGKTETEREEKVESRKEIGRERDEKKAQIPSIVCVCPKFSLVIILPQKSVNLTPLN